MKVHMTLSPAAAAGWTEFLYSVNYKGEIKTSFCTCGVVALTYSTQFLHRYHVI